MSVAPPKVQTLSRRAPRLVVRVGSVGLAPIAGDEVDYLVPLRIERSAGGGRADSCTFAMRLDVTGERIVDTLAPKGIDKQIEVLEVDAQGRLLRILFWGKLASQPVQLGSGEQITYNARLDPHLFGKPLGRVPYWEHISEMPIELDHKLVFNPEVDGKIKGNQSSQTDEERDDIYCLFDAFAVDNPKARELHGQQIYLWKIYEAVHFLCWVLNPDETYIKNPSLSDCRVALELVDGLVPVLQNREIKAGAYLPQALDELLTPYGCGWYIAFEDAIVSERHIKFYRRNEGIKRDVLLQRPGEMLRPGRSNVADASIAFDVAHLANVIQGVGAREVFESTWELKKLWSDTFDTVPYDSLKSKEPEYAHVGRKWGLNENGAWTGLRPGLTEAHDIEGDIGRPGETLPTTRKFLECLSRISAGNFTGPNAPPVQFESRGYWLRWWNPALETEEKWEKADWSFSVLDTECAITLETVPEELWAIIQGDPDEARLQLTACIEGDICPTATATRQNTSPNADEIVLRLDLSDKFHFRTVLEDSIFFADKLTSDEVDDFAKMQAYVDRVRDQEDAAELSCSIVLEGIDHPEFQIGHLVTKITGRNISLQRSSVASSQKPLQIVGINLDVQGQRTELLLESLDEELF